MRLRSFSTLKIPIRTGRKDTALILEQADLAHEMRSILAKDRMQWVRG